MEGLGDLVNGSGFWRREVVDSVRDGLRKGSDFHKHYGLPNIREDFQTMRSDNKKADGQFGETAQKLLNGLTFAAKSVVRAGASLAGGVYGLGYATVVPTAKVAYNVTVPVLQASVMGTAVPALKYLWNGTAWVLTQHSNMPSEDTRNFMVYFVRL